MEINISLFHSLGVNDRSRAVFSHGGGSISAPADLVACELSCRCQLVLLLYSDLICSSSSLFLTLTKRGDVARAPTRKLLFRPPRAPSKFRKQFTWPEGNLELFCDGADRPTSSDGLTLN